jgi:hypothetical protein
MNLDDAVVLETFANRIEAEMAAGLLQYDVGRESEAPPAFSGRKVDVPPAVL